MYSCGAPHSSLLEREQVVAINSYLCGTIFQLVKYTDHLQTFKRVELHGTTYYSETYDRVKKRNGYTVSYSESDDGHRQFGLVQLYVLSDAGMLALVQVLEQVDHCPLFDGFTNGGVRPRPLSTTFSVKRGVLRAVPVDFIQEKSLFVEMNGLACTYVVCFPNAVEFS